jgi:hypothetical protein
MCKFSPQSLYSRCNENALTVSLLRSDDWRLFGPSYDSPARPNGQSGTPSEPPRLVVEPSLQLISEPLVQPILLVLLNDVTAHLIKP